MKLHAPIKRRHKGRIPKRYTMGRAAAGAKIYSGALVCRQASGHFIQGITSSTVTGAGVSRFGADNIRGDDGDCMVTIQVGIWLFDNDLKDPVKSYQVGYPCFVVNDNTVAGSDAFSSRGRAGKVHAVDADGVWVEFI